MIRLYCQQNKINYKGVKKMKEKDFLKYDFIKQNYPNILEIYPTKAGNTIVLNKVLFELQKEYELVKVFNNWIRAFKK